MDIRRFGPGHRRPDGPPGTTGVSAQVIQQDARGSIHELAFQTHAMITPHDNPNTSFFIVVSGGGFVQVGDERARVMHGEAVVWPADVLHGAYTEGSEMRAIVVELAGPDDGWARELLEATAAATATGPATPAVGELAPRASSPTDYDRTSGEPSGKPVSTGRRRLRGRARGRGARPAAALLLALVVAACGASPVVPVASIVPGASILVPGEVAPAPPLTPAPSRTASPTPTVPPAGAAIDGPGPSLVGLTGPLQADLASAVHSLHLPGVQATILLSDGETWSGAAGIADQAARRPMTTADIFDVGSITKTFVAADILSLAQAGTLGLDDPLSRWVPTYPNAKAITLRELLSHTSGLADYFANEHLLSLLGARPTASWAPSALLPYVGKVHFPPGTGWLYSNTNYLLLGEVIEAATGRSLAAELQAHLLVPQGLTSTALQVGASGAPAPALGPLALPYERVPGPKVAYRSLSDGSGYLPFTSLATSLGAAGSLVSTSADLARWGAALYGGRVLQPASLAAMEDTSISTPWKPAFIYGLGAQRLAIDTFTSYGHGGACSGYRAALRYFPTLGASVVVLTNLDGPDPDQVVAQLVVILTAPRGGPRRV